MIVELQRFCEGSGTVEAVFSPTQLPRLLDSVADTAGQVSMRVRGSLDARGRPNLDVHVGGELSVLCQRCLRPMSVPLVIGQTLAFGDDDDAGIAAEPGAFDPDGVELLPTMAHIDLAELVEEEVLLSLPMLPRHAECDLPAPMDAETGSPFAVLQGLTTRLGDWPLEDN